MINLLETENNQRDSISFRREEALDLIGEFRARYGIENIIGICGGADEKNIGSTSGIIFDLLVNLKDLKIAIASGGTSGGIPELATTIARSSGIPTIGIYPSEGKKYALLKSLDLAIETIPPTLGKAGFGTETPSLIEILHGMVVIGGEFGTLVEVATTIKINKDRLKKELPVIYLCPIQGTGGIADLIRRLPICKVGSANLPEYCLPEEEIYSGADAARFLRSKLYINKL